MSVTFSINRLSFIFFVLMGFSSLTARAGDLLVLYPEIREPYRQVFNNIVEGIRKKHKGDITDIALKKNDTPKKIQQWLDDNDEDGIIALGTRSLNLVSALKVRPITVVGAVITEPSKANFPSLTLIPDPNTIFEKVSKVLPTTKRIHVIHSKATSSWIIDIAKIAAKNNDIQLITHDASDAREIALAYRDIMKKMNSKNDVLWLAANGASLDWAILKNILENSWRSNLRVISSNVADVKKGVLLSFLPDHRSMGEELVELYSRYHSKRSTVVEVYPVKSLGVAINLRTADHLGLEFDKRTRKTFSLMYPPPRR